MRTCGHCGHDNADHLAYCSACGRRLPTSDRLSAGPETRSPTSSDNVIPAGTTPVAPAAFAATVAVAAVHKTAPARGTTESRHVLTSGIGSVRYVFEYVRGRMDAEGRRRRLIEERDGAQRLVEGALIELGQVVLANPGGPPELTGLVEAVGVAHARRQAAITDLAAAEKFRASEDLRLGLIEATAESEWKACEGGTTGLDETLRALDDQKRQVEQDLARPGNGAADGDRRSAAGSALHSRYEELSEQIRSLRERGAALRAAMIAARTKLDQAAAARRQAAAAVAASLTGYTRDRADAEEQVRRTTAEIGQTAMRLRWAAPRLMPGYARIDRLQEITADRDRQIAAAEGTSARYDPRKLIAGVGVLVGILGGLGALGIGLWVLLR